MFNKTRKRPKKSASSSTRRTSRSGEPTTLSSSPSPSAFAQDETMSSPSQHRGKRSILAPRIYLDILKPNKDYLNITVKAGRHLYGDKDDGIDSYVRIHIVGQPPQSDWVTYTRISDANPSYNETYTLDTCNTIGRSHLQVSVWRVENTDHSCLGIMAFPFFTINIQNKRLLGWFELLDTTSGLNSYRPFVSLDCRVSKNSDVGEMAEMQLSSNAAALETNRHRAVIDLVNYNRRYLISLVNKYKIYCKSLKNYISQSHYEALFGGLEVVIQTQINMFDYVKQCYNGRYAVGSVLRSWVPELVCVIDHQRHRDRCVRMIQDLEQSDCPDIIDVIKDKYKEYLVLLGMPLQHLKQLAKCVRNIHYYSLDKHPDFANITWVKQYLYWLIVQVESPQRIAHNKSLNHTRHDRPGIDRSFTFTMPDELDDADCDGYLRPNNSRPNEPHSVHTPHPMDHTPHPLGVGCGNHNPHPLDLQDLVEYDLGEISSLPDSADSSEDMEPNTAGDVKITEDEEEFEWPVVPPEELEMDNEELLGNQRTASLAKTLDQVVQVFSSVSRKKVSTASPLPDTSNWKTIQKLVLPPDEEDGSSCPVGSDKGSFHSDKIEEEEEDVLHISVNQTLPYYYHTFEDKSELVTPACNGDTPSDLVELDVDEDPSYRSSNTHLTDSSPVFSPRRQTKRSSSSLHSQDSGRSPHFRHRNSTPSFHKKQMKSDSALDEVYRADLVRTPDLRIRKIYAARSLNDIIFSEEDYDIAAV